MNKIGWCSITFNPVWGCKNHCEYCYARGIAKRFGGVRFTEEWKYRTEHNMDATRFKLQNSLDLINFKPTFLHSQFEKRLPRKPQRVFVGSMSEIYYWEPEWIEMVIEKVKEYPQHTFQFLTKHPQVYLNYDFPDNCWLGTTITTNIDAEYISNFHKIGVVKGNIYFYSIEPILCQISPRYLEGVDWVIIGAETGNRKGKVIPNLEWVNDIINYCRKNDISVYVKDSIKGFYPIGIKEFPHIKEYIC